MPKPKTQVEMIGERVLNLRRTAKALKDGPDRNRLMRRLAEGESFVAMVSVILEFEDDLAGAVANYARSPDERAMDAGGLATMRKFRNDLETLLIPVEPEAAAPKGA